MARNELRVLALRKELALALGSYENRKVFASPSTWEFIKFNCFYQLVGFECHYHLWLFTPLKLHSFSSKMMIHRSPPPPRIFMAKSQKATINMKPRLQWLTKNLFNITWTTYCRMTSPKSIFLAILHSGTGCPHPVYIVRVGCLSPNWVPAVHSSTVVLYLTISGSTQRCTIPLGHTCGCYPD